MKFKVGDRVDLDGFETGTIEGIDYMTMKYHVLWGGRSYHCIDDIEWGDKNYIPTRSPNVWKGVPK